MTAATRHQKLKLTKENFIILLTGAAGVIYNSWPLGFILDPNTAKYSQASQLEVIGHPYYQVFIAGDVISSLLLIISAVLIWVYLSRKLELRLIAIGLAAFGIFTSIASLLPPNCSITSYLRCGAGVSHGIGLDLIFSSLAVAGLLIALGVILLNLKRIEFLKTKFGTAAVSVSVLWILSLLTFSVLAIQQVQSANIVQYIELTLTGLVMLTIGIEIRTLGS